MKVATLIACLLVLATGALAEKAPYDYPAAGAIDRQGGDTIETATAIGGVPFSGAGTTVGYIHNYDEVCPYTGSTSPDVVYSFVACDTGTLSITLCGGSGYDTKLYVYHNVYTPGAPYRCNDDYCPGYVSELSVASGNPVPVVAGDIYYIVVDGYYGASGSYTIDITGMDCTTATEESTFSSAKALYR